MEKCRNWPTDQGLRRQEGKEARLEKGGDYKDSYPDWREVMVLVETLKKKIFFQVCKTWSIIATS